MKDDQFKLIFQAKTTTKTMGPSVRTIKTVPFVCGMNHKSSEIIFSVFSADFKSMEYSVTQN